MKGACGEADKIGGTEQDVSDILERFEREREAAATRRRELEGLTGQCHKLLDDVDHLGPLLHTINSYKREVQRLTERAEFAETCFEVRTALHPHVPSSPAYCANIVCIQCPPLCSHQRVHAASGELPVATPQRN